MDLNSLFKKKVPLIAIDVGASGVRLVELNNDNPTHPLLVNLGHATLPTDVFANQMIAHPEKVAQVIATLLEGISVAGKKIVTAVPANSVFSKRIKVPDMDDEDLISHVEFEAGNFLPQGNKNVSIDYHVIQRTGKNQLDIIVVAVKNEIVDSFMQIFNMAGLDVAILDVEQGAVQNIYETAHPDSLNQTAAIINVGGRYSSITICREGIPLFLGDVSIGGKAITDSILTEKRISFAEAEKLKKAGTNEASVKELLVQGAEYLATELTRQLTFLWSSVGGGEGIDKIFVSGGGSSLVGLTEEIGKRTGIETHKLDPFKSIKVGDNFQPSYIEEVTPFFSVCLGLGTRRFRDRVKLDDL